MTRRRYSAEHFWVISDGALTTIGLASYITKRIGLPLALLLPEVGTEVVRGEVFGEIEAGKVVCELTAPVSGVLVEVNRQAEEEPKRLLSDPDSTWLVRLADVAGGELGDLYSESEYHAYLARGAVSHPFERRFWPPSS